MQSPNGAHVVILGTGGTIAGIGADPDDHVGYRSAQIGIQALLAGIPALADRPLEAEQVAQIDSKDMDFATWQRLAHRIAHHLERAEVAGIVVTHGTDTMEETAYFLQRVLAPAKPVMLTGAMRPASARNADGPRNLEHAVRLASDGRVAGVCVVMAGRAWPAASVRKRDARELDAFDAGADGPMAHIDDRGVELVRVGASNPQQPPLGLAAIAAPPSDWPWVEIVFNHAGASGLAVDLLAAQGVRGWIAAGTGNGSLAQPLEAALVRAARSGAVVWRCSRCADGSVVDTADRELATSPVDGAARSRVELILRLLNVAKSADCG